MSSDSLFSILPRATQKKIDSAFSTVTKNRENSPLPGGFISGPGGFIHDAENEQLGGGFILDDSDQGGGFIRDEGQGGGFIRDDDLPSTSGGGGFIQDEDDSNVPTHIPLSLIPSALQILDLPPDDDEVLAVFRNAATGWASSSNRVDTRKLGEEDQYVSRDDWRSVCAVLLEHDSGGGKRSDEDVEMADLGVESDGAADSDEYQQPDDERGEDDDDEYIEGPSTSAARRRTRQKARKSLSLSPPPSPSSSIRPRKFTPRQRQTCVDTYALFFPSVTPEELLVQKIMIKDIQRVAKLLNEKLKTEEVRAVCFNASMPVLIFPKMVEMLETFSTSPDKSMNFDDFCRMMITAKLA